MCSLEFWTGEDTEVQTNIVFLRRHLVCGMRFAIFILECYTSDTVLGEWHHVNVFNMKMFQSKYSNIAHVQTQKIATACRFVLFDFEQ